MQTFTRSPDTQPRVRGMRFWILAVGSPQELFVAPGTYPSHAGVRFWGVSAGASAEATGIAPLSALAGGSVAHPQGLGAIQDVVQHGLAPQLRTGGA